MKRPVTAFLALSFILLSPLSSGAIPPDPVEQEACEIQDGIYRHFSDPCLFPPCPPGPGRWRCVFEERRNFTGEKTADNGGADDTFYEEDLSVVNRKIRYAFGAVILAAFIIYLLRQKIFRKTMVKKH